MTIVLTALAFVLFSASPVVAVTIDYTLTVESDGAYEFSLPWSGASQWFLDGVEVTLFDDDPTDDVTRGTLTLTAAQPHSLQIVLDGDDVPSLTLEAGPGVSVTAVPEPATLLLLGLGLAALAIAGRRRARREVLVRR